MNKEIKVLREKSLAEILDNASLNPFSKLDLNRMAVRYNVSLDYFNENTRACVTFRGEEYWFIRNERDQLYYMRTE